MNGTTSSTIDRHPAADLQVSGDTIRLWLRDGRTVTAPLEWYPRLCHGGGAERNNWRPVANGTAIHWPDLDEDISIAEFLVGSEEGQEHPVVADLQITEDTIRLWLRDGRTLTVPLEWYPRLCHGTAAERNNWRPVGDGTAIHWPDLDEDISIGGLLCGPSLERAVTLGSWLLARRQGRGLAGHEIAEWNRSRRPIPLR